MGTMGRVVHLSAVVLALVAFSVQAEAGVTNEDGSEMKRTKYLVLDSRVISETKGARLALGTVVKDERNPLFGEDRPWEPRFDNMQPNVLFDAEAGLYRCWYSPFIIDERTTGTPPDKRPATNYIAAKPNAREMGLCYAESNDGIVWEKPELGICEFNGSTANNIVIRVPHGPGVFHDPRDPDPMRRYKTIFKHEGVAMSVAFSPDGLHWGDWVACPEIAVAGDTHNNAFWAPELDKYVGITRMWGGEPRVRQVGRTESEDFLHWTQAQVALQGLEPHLQTYAMPVFRYGGVYLGLIALFNTQADRTHVELAWSPDTVEWHRVCPGTPLIPNGDTEGGYDWGCVYPGAYPIFLEDTIRLYYAGSNNRHTTWRNGFLCLANLRPDGFAGYECVSADEPAVLLTECLALCGDTLRLTADVEPGGSIVVALENEEGEERVRSAPVAATCSDGAVAWRTGWDWSSVNGAQGRLRFEIDRSRLYSFGFGT